MDALRRSIEAELQEEASTSKLIDEKKVRFNSNEKRFACALEKTTNGPSSLIYISYFDSFN